jgi:hypothetical protein
MPGMGVGDRVVRAVLAVALLASLGVLLATRLLGEGEPQAGTVGDRPAAPTSSAPAPVVPPLRERSEPVSAQVLAGLRFVDVTDRAGLAVGGPAEPPRPEDLDGGAAVADLDRDGDHDLLLTSAGPASGLYRNDGGRFTDISRASRLDRLEHATAASFADVDGDGDLDAFVGGPGTAFGRLLVNDGSGRFADESRARGVVGRPAATAGERRVRGVDFGDVDGDGDLDLLVTDWNSSAVVAAAVAGAGPEGFATQCEYAAFLRREYDRGSVEPTGDSRLFLNDGSGSFEDRTREWGLAGLGVALPLTPQFHDLDGDGRLDLVVAGDVCTSRVYRNEGDRFLDHTASSGAGTADNGMGSWLQDLDGDARPDWLVTSIGYPTADGSCPRVSLFAGCSGNRAFLNEGRMRFRDATDDLALRQGWWGWGVAAADFTGDGRLQVVATNGRPPTPGPVDPDDPADVYNDAFRDDPTRLWVRADRQGAFAEAAVQVGVDHEDVAFGLVPFDYDRDGRLDLLVANGGAPPALYRNVTPRRHWLAIRLEDPFSPGNAQGLGARVELARADGTTSTHWVHTSGSYQSQRPAEVHVGLGDDARPVRVTVWWPGARAPQVVRVAGVDRVVTVTRDARPG